MSPQQPPILPEDYATWLTDLKREISTAQQRAALAVNAELITLYHRIGTEIQHRQVTLGWGAKVINRLARDLKEAFPEMRGWSTTNLKYMRFLPSIALTVNLVSSLLTNCPGSMLSHC